MSQSKIGGRLLPDSVTADSGAENINIPSKHGADIAAMIDTLRELSDMIRTGTGEPSGAARSTGSIYLRQDGSSVTSLYVGLGNTWLAVS